MSNVLCGAGKEDAPHSHLPALVASLGKRQAIVGSLVKLNNKKDAG
ncbi:MAG: hypothetical protein OXM61_16715 [Candidatus Poribacteria bacterium]|nr:hypothetical protein [Candidatus Poribacteria bacterium]